jgi:uncharacterized protein YbcC (UPF0753/DUF2309 family)
MDIIKILEHLRHYLPAQAPLKDFIHHNTLHAFQTENFYSAIEKASTIFGSKTIFSLNEFRDLYKQGKIKNEVIEKVISDNVGQSHINEWKTYMLETYYHQEKSHRIGRLRKLWKQNYHVDIDLKTQPILFRTICNYFDQGIALWNFPINSNGFLATIKSLESKSYFSFFKEERAKKLLFSNQLNIKKLLEILVGDERYFEQYLFDQQFSHQGWSGMVAVIESNQNSLLDSRKITLEEFIVFELLLEIDALDNKFGPIWAPLAHQAKIEPLDLFSEVNETQLFKVLTLWQQSFEWSYYYQVLQAIKLTNELDSIKSTKISSFQALFCIDDRECSFRRYLEMFDSNCETFGTPGFFGVEFYFQPQNGQFYTKVCPAPMSPNHIIKESNDMSTNEKDMHFNKNSHSLFFGWLISQSLGFWSAIKLALSVFKPSMSPATSYSFRHMNKLSELTIENIDNQKTIEGYQIGFKLEEMAIRVENLLKSIGLVKDFSPIIYTIGHGSTSVNNTHYAGYDCGACSGRPGSVNARVISYMCNHAQVREILRQRGIDIPSSTQFVGGLRDTSRDTIVFYDVEKLSNENKQFHIENEKKFFKASDYNAKERSRRFDSINSKLSVEKIHEKVKIRSVSLFEPRPELNHATNSLCIVGSRKLTKHLFLDRRAFMNSYDYNIDPDGHYLTGILNAVAPVCGGINLEYYFSRVDNNKYGAGTKLAHNVMGLIGVANGIDGDLRPGLPSQMIELHDPVRLLVIVEHYPEVVAQVIQKNQNTFQWFSNQWINLVVLDPIKKEFFKFDKNQFIPCQIIETTIDSITEINDVITTTSDNIDVKILNYSNHE